MTVRCTDRRRDRTIKKLPHVRAFDQLKVIILHVLAAVRVLDASGTPNLCFL